VGSTATIVTTGSILEIGNYNIYNLYIYTGCVSLDRRLGTANQNRKEFQQNVDGRNLHYSEMPLPIFVSYFFFKNMFIIILTVLFLASYGQFLIAIITFTIKKVCICSVFLDNDVLAHINGADFLQ